MIEVLVASLIVVSSLAAMVSTWYVSMNITELSNDQGVAYNLARQTIEQVKETGFYNTTEASTAAPTMTYYDQNENSVASSAAKYQVATSVVSSAYASGTTPADTATRTVTVVVSLKGSSTSLCTLTTYLVRAGI